jgi:hypothetical protein
VLATDVPYSIEEQEDDAVSGFSEHFTYIQTTTYQATCRFGSELVPSVGFRSRETQLAYYVVRKRGHIVGYHIDGVLNFIEAFFVDGDFVVFDGQNVREPCVQYDLEGNPTVGELTHLVPLSSTATLAMNPGSGCTYTRILGDALPSTVFQPQAFGCSTF